MECTDTRLVKTMVCVRRIATDPTAVTRERRINITDMDRNAQLIV